eukprot:Tbor_TRINITY_DN5650_c1_g1::TRINITY_DN5650_c1_g1_i1::g.8990::m.8990
MSSKPLFQKVISALESYAPLKLAGSWDNVGIMVESPKPNGLGTVLLTIDLTPEVLLEAISHKAEVIIAYHPPIFTAMKSLRLSSAKQKILLDAITGGISIYSPHTALDACKGGINDWLLECCRIQLKDIRPIVPREEDPSLGEGRIATIACANGCSVQSIVDNMRLSLCVPTARVALPDGWTGATNIKRLAVCAGSGGSLFNSIRDGDRIDMLVSGEMGHHDVLAALASGKAVVLFEHTNTERGFLQQKLKGYLENALGLSLENVQSDSTGVPSSSNIRIVVSSTDKDPLVVWPVVAS